MHKVRALRTAAVEGTQQTRALERRALKRFWYIKDLGRQLDSAMGVQADAEPRRDGVTAAEPSG